MKILNSTTPIITLVMEENEKNVSMIGGDKVEVIIVSEGAESIDREAFRLCPNLKELHLPKSIKYLGDRIFKPDYSEVKIIYEGSLEDFKKIDYEREVYIPGPYDRYPYYSDYGASSEFQRFYRLYDNYEMYCEVYCKEDSSQFTLGSKDKHLR